jgi:hypothetical protein
METKEIFPTENLMLAATALRKHVLETEQISIPPPSPPQPPPPTPPQSSTFRAVVSVPGVFLYG